MATLEMPKAASVTLGGLHVLENETRELPPI